jgi:DNA-binding protein H-NS
MTDTTHTSTDERMALLEALTFEDLVNLKMLAEELILQRRQEMLEQVRAEMAHKAKLLGMTPEEMLAAPTKKARTPAAVKYRHGEDSWTGKGRTPLWMQELLAQGRTLEEFAV